MSSDFKPENIKKIARDKAMQWYRRIEDRVAPVVVFSGLIVESTAKWASQKRNQHTTYFQVKRFLESPCRNLAGFLRAREVEALSTLWGLSWVSPGYSNPRKVYPVIWVDRTAPDTVGDSLTPRKDSPTE